MLPPLNTIWDTAMTQGDAVKQQISGAVNALKQGQNTVNNLVGQLTTTADGGQKLTGVYDGYRYSVSQRLGRLCRGGWVAAVHGLSLEDWRRLAGRGHSGTDPCCMVCHAHIREHRHCSSPTCNLPCRNSEKKTVHIGSLHPATLPNCLGALPCRPSHPPTSTS